MRLSKKIMRLSACAAAMLAVTSLSTNAFDSHVMAREAFAQTTGPLTYTFSSNGVLFETDTMAQSPSPYLWLQSGGMLVLVNGIGSSIRGTLSATDPIRAQYAQNLPSISDNGTHPQNAFKLFAKTSIKDVSASVYLNRKSDNLANAANRHSYTGESIIARYQNEKTFYYAGIRVDGSIVIKKQNNGSYHTLASKQIFPGTYDANTNYNLIPLSKWIGLKLVVVDTSDGVKLTAYTDIGKTGTWKLALTAIDDPQKFGPAITNGGYVGIESDFADVQIDTFAVQNASGTTAPNTTVAQPVQQKATNYDAIVLADSPVMFFGMSGSGTESDKSGNGHTGTYTGSPVATIMPNGDSAKVFNGSSQMLSVPSHKDFSIPTTKKLTWEGWVRPDTLQFANASGDGYIDWMGKCEDYSPTCEWEARLYSQTTPQGRENRLSAYVFNNSAGLGSGADWQPASSIISAGKWLHVVAEYQIDTTPSGCNSAYPGSIDIWVNGVKWNSSSHRPTGCMSQYSIRPQANNSHINIGTMARDTWFKGAVGKVAIYNYLLSDAQIKAHYTAMTGQAPTGSCGSTCTF